MTREVMALPHVVQDRMRAAELAAALKGHKIGNWLFFDVPETGQLPIWRGRCETSGCEVVAHVHVEEDGGFTAIAAQGYECPFVYPRISRKGKGGWIFERPITRQKNRGKKQFPVKPCI